MRGAAVWPGVLALCLVQFVDVLGVTVVVTALPRMLADRHAPDPTGAEAASLAVIAGTDSSRKRDLCLIHLAHAGRRAGSWAA